MVQEAVLRYAEGNLPLFEPGTATERRCKAHRQNFNTV